jgi:glycosyltransferase involved in cell wall biosynthesis
MCPDWELIVVLPAEGPLRHEVDRLGVGIEVLSLPPRAAATGDYALRASAVVAAVPGAARYLLRLRRVLARLRPDIVHSNGFKMHLAAAWSRPAGAKVVWHLHDYVSRRSRSAALLRWSAHRCQAVIANSQSVADDAREALRATESPQAVLNGVDLTVFRPVGVAADLDQLAGVARAPSGIVRVGLVGTYARWKGHSTFLKAIAALPGGLPIRAYIVGGPVYQTTGSQWTRDELEAEARRLQIGERVGFIDFVASPARIFRALDIVVHASTEPEPFGLVVAEAMACGRAVIAAESGGVTEIVTPGINALMHRPGNVGDLASCITNLARDPELRTRLGRAARLRAETALGSPRFVGEICRAYDRVMANAVASVATVTA